MKKKVLLLVVATLFLLVACSKEEQHYEELGAAGNFYDKISVDLDELTAIQAICERNEENFSIIMLEDSDGFALFSRYFDCELEEITMPMKAYELDPVSFVFEMGDRKEEAYFITAEEANGQGRTLYLIQNGKAYRLLVEDWNELSRELFSDTIYTTDSFNPIQSFLHYRQLNAIADFDQWEDNTLVTERYIFTRSSEEVPRVGIGGAKGFFEPYKSYKEIIQNADFVVMGTLQEIRKKAVLDIDYYLDCAFLTAEVDEIWHGECDSAKVDGLRWGDSIQVDGAGSMLGISEHMLQIGEKYLFFLNSDGFADECFGILEITDDDMVRPVFSIAPEKIEEYYIPLQTLKDMM